MIPNDNHAGAVPSAGQRHYELGLALQAQGRLDEAVYHFERASALNAGFALPQYNLGWLRMRQGRLDEAAYHFERALAINPKYAAAHYGLGYVLRVRGELQAAAAAFQRAIALGPNFSAAIAQLVYLLYSTCQWTRLQEWAPRLDALTVKELREGRKPGDGPIGSMRYCPDMSRHLDVAQAWSREISQRALHCGLRFSFNSRQTNKKKLRIAYASGTFGNHPVTYCTKGLFARHDRQRFDIFLYSYSKDDGSVHRADVRAACDVLVDISGLSPSDAATKIYNDEIDILVDLDGYTRQGRLGIFALKPAPIQVSYLGFAATTGAEFLDYIIVDRTVCPEEHKIYYSEKFVYLPHCFAIDSSSARAVDDRPLQRCDYGLPEDAFVFCSFNAPAKIDTVIFERWMSILRQIPGSILWLYKDNEFAKKNLIAAAAARGVDRRRLIFAEHTDFNEHVNRLRLADLALDTCLYSGGATTSNALAAGVPVVTLLGTRFGSRMSASMVRAVGLPELVTHTLNDYEALVLDLARNPDKLHRMKEALWRSRDTAPLFDARRFARNLEKAFIEMWQIFQAGAEPRQIEVVEE